jgi:hypothetical protein
MATTPRRCRVCGCTDEDCTRCVIRTGRACHWVEPDLCSACVHGRDETIDSDLPCCRCGAAMIWENCPECEGRGGGFFDIDSDDDCLLICDVCEGVGGLWVCLVAKGEHCDGE